MRQSQICIDCTTPKLVNPEKPIHVQEVLLKLSSGSIIHLTLTLELKMILQNNSNIFPTSLLPERFHQNCPAASVHCENR